MIDSHCHLAGPEFETDLPEVVARARESGIVRVLVILSAADDQEMARAARVRNEWSAVRFAVGVHPHQAHTFRDDPGALAVLLERRLQEASPVAIGEIGLDYHYGFSARDVQQAVFRAQLRLARSRSLPVVLHVREAEADALQILDEEGGAALRGVFHCFSGDRDAAARALATGFFLSIAGMATFPAAGSLRDAVTIIPEDRLLIETDSPFLAPVPHRGTRNEPSLVTRVLETVSHARGIAPALLASRLVDNYDALFDQNARKAQHCKD